MTRCRQLFGILAFAVAGVGDRRDDPNVALRRSHP